MGDDCEKTAKWWGRGRSVRMDGAGSTVLLRIDGAAAAAGDGGGVEESGGWWE